MFHRRLLWYHWVQDLLCRDQSLSGQYGPVSLTGCSLASGPCKEENENIIQNVWKIMCNFNMLFPVMFTFVHLGELWDNLPVHNVQGVEVSKCTCNFSSVEPSSGLEEDPLSLEMIEQLENEKKNICQHPNIKQCLIFWSVVYIWARWDFSLPLHR